MITLSQFVLAQAMMCSEPPLKWVVTLAEYGIKLVVLLVFIFIVVAIIVTIFKIIVTIFKNFSIKKISISATITGLVGVWLNNEDVLLNGNVSIDSLMRSLNPIVTLNAILTSFSHIKHTLGC